MTNTIGIRTRSYEETIIDDTIKTDGIAVIVHKDNNNVWVHTVGNTVRGLPELIMFCSEYNIINNMYILQRMSNFLYEKNITIENNKEITFLGRHFHPVSVDNIFIHMFADIVLKYYNHSPKISFIQLLVPDRSGLYPYSPNYDNNYLNQPHLQCH